MDIILKEAFCLMYRKMRVPLSDCKYRLSIQYIYSIYSDYIFRLGIPYMHNEIVTIPRLARKLPIHIYSEINHIALNVA